MVDMTDDVAKMVERLSAPGTWARHRDNLVASSAAETLVRDDAPFEAASLIQSLSSQLAEANERYAREAHAKMVALEQLAEARANFNQVSRTCGEYLDQIDDLKADRGRLAADNKRLREAGQALIAFDDYPVEAKRPDVFAMRRQALRTALAGKAGEA